ncbi:MAG: hypothetical protein PVG42_11395 [Lysobacterales bacterium]
MRSFGIPWAIGVSVLLGALLLWIGILFIEDERLLRIGEVILWGSPLVAALVASWLTPRRKFLVGLSMAPIAAFLQVLSNGAFQALGRPVDFPGAEGGMLFFMLVLAGAAIPALVGTLVGMSLSTRERR